MGEDLRKVYEQVEQNVADRVDVAYQRFYERVHENKENNVISSEGKYVEPGHTRFKGRNRYKSFTFPQYGNGCELISENDSKKNKDSKKKKNKKDDKKKDSNIEKKQDD